ncbi:hypothetical protein HRR86_005076 [Exophiala dermatitidis]|nr:hypothetical protein HRR73_007539 [Exophiala dermatitidis]KAJ4597669.1 hypothetical protein HRR84_004430 [Exophiala dermatitidis]KAJ4624643.1 hypothetical protein HRR86_005076 [Exophiala dermatitidis]
MIYDTAELHQLALVGRDAIWNMQDWCTIAKRGVRLIDVLLDLHDILPNEQSQQPSLELIILGFIGSPLLLANRIRSSFVQFVKKSLDDPNMLVPRACGMSWPVSC